MDKILYLCKSQYKNNWVIELEDKIIYYKSIPKKLTHEFELVSFIKICKTLISKEKIQGIYYSTDKGALIAAALCEECNLFGPNFTGTFHCHHKYYTRLLTDSLEVAPLLLKDLENYIISEYPFYLKDPCSILGNLGFYIQDKNDFEKAKILIQKYLPINHHYFLPLIKRYLNTKNYSYAFSPMMMIEPIVKQEQFTIEGFVRNKEVKYIAVTDTHFYKNTRIFDHFSLPTKISPKVIEKTKIKLTHYIEKLGLNNTFFNAEFFYNKNNTTLIEINPRSAACFKNLYQEVYGFDIIAAGQNLCLNQNISLNTIPKKHAGQFTFMIDNPINTKDIYLFNTREQLPFKIKLLKKFNTDVEVKGHNGFAVAQVELFGDSYEEIKNLAHEYRTKYFKNILL